MLSTTIAPAVTAATKAATVSPVPHGVASSVISTPSRLRSYPPARQI